MISKEPRSERKPSSQIRNKTVDEKLYKLLMAAAEIIVQKTSMNKA